MKRIFLLFTFLTSISLVGMERQQTSDTALFGYPSLTNLPTDLKVLIIKKLSSRLPSWQDGTAIRNLGKTNKQFYQLINSEKTTEAIVKSFMEPNAKLRAAIDLFSPGAATWLKKNKDNLYGDMLHEFQRIFEWALRTENKEKELAYKKMAFLLHVGVDPNAKIKGFFPDSKVSLLNYAISFRDKKTVALLATFGADLNEIENDKTILDGLIEWVSDDDLPAPCYFHMDKAKELIVWLRSKGAKTVAELQQEQS